MRLLRLGAVAVALAGTLSSCATPRYSDVLAGAAYAPYNLSAGDKLRVLVFGQENLSNIYVVDGAGRISMPLIGIVPASGMTTTALEGEVARRLRNGYIREPHVSIEIEQYRPFFVMGEVTQAGQFPYVNGLTVQTAVAIAGGFGPRAERGGVEVTRRFGDRIVTGYVPLSYPLKPGDTVTVRERWF